MRCAAPPASRSGGDRLRESSLHWRWSAGSWLHQLSAAKSWGSTPARERSCGAAVSGSPELPRPLLEKTDSLFRLNTSDGKVTHRSRSPGTVVSAWLKQDGALVGGTTDSQVVSIRPDDLRRNWAVKVDAPVLGSPASLGDTVYLATRSGTLYRIDPGSAPSLRLLRSLDWPVTTPVTIAGRQLLLGGADGIIRALRTDGTEIWRIRIWRPVELGPFALEDGLVAVGGNGDLHRFRQ
jgi:outer membrane protein assembly factor BamB